MTKIADIKLWSVSFHNNLVAMYYIENSWCEAEPNTVLAVVVFAPAQMAAQRGFRTAKFGYLSDAPTRWLKRCGHRARIF